MIYNDSENWIGKMNRLGKLRVPFLFIIDFDMKDVIVESIDKLDPEILYKFGDVKNYTLTGKMNRRLHFAKIPVTFDKYKKGFDFVLSQINLGNSFLTNLTYPTKINCNYNLKELFNVAHAKYKLYFKNKFIVSSPETFIKINNNKIYTYPMKGTIDAAIPNAESIILNDIKETAEHYTIVDLLRNDLSIVSVDVKVNKFRYIDKIKTFDKELLQVSSEIEGKLPEDYNNHLGDIFNKLLPAGSISGAPKKKTVEIIKSAELDERGYYTGVFGYFDGVNLDSAVMIRYIENINNQLIYRSGCGITSMSDCKLEYNEMIDKVYIPKI